MQLQHYPTQSFMSHPTIQNQPPPGYYASSNPPFMQWQPQATPYVQLPSGSIQNVSWANFPQPSGPQVPFQQLGAPSFAIVPSHGPPAAEFIAAQQYRTAASQIKPLKVWNLYLNFSG
jgi:hypothetical protein